MKANKTDKLFKNKNFKFFNLGRIMCLLFLVIYMGFIFTLMMQLDMGYQEVIMKNPILNAGFFICFMNLFIWYRTRNAIDKLHTPLDVSQFKLRLSLSCFAQLIMFNYPAAILFGLTLYKNINWKEESLMKAFQNCKENNKILPIIIDVIVLALFIFLATWFATSFS